MRCRFGEKVRLVMPVVLRPTPPRYFALPRRVIWLPITGFLPQTAHSMPMSVALIQSPEGTSAEREQYSDAGGPDKTRTFPVWPRAQCSRRAPCAPLGDSGRGETEVVVTSR